MFFQTADRTVYRLTNSLTSAATELNNVGACARRGEVWGPEWFQILRDL